MNKGELVDAIAKKSNLTKKDTETVLNAFMDTVGKTLKKGDKLTLVGFGTFQARKRAARVGRNPQTQAEIKIPARIAPVFSAGKILKDTVSGLAKTNNSPKKTIQAKNTKKKK
jgi:DNA-binding protein HU-beta